MKTISIIAFLALALLSSRADRADMDRLLADIDNHNRQLEQVMSSQDAAQIKKEIAQLREDVKSLARKSAGLTDNNQRRLNEKAEDIARVTADMENAVGDETTLRKGYRNLQTHLRTVKSLASVNPGKAEEVKVAGNRGDLLTDIRNHNAQLGETITARHGVDAAKHASMLREDVKAYLRAQPNLTPEMLETRTSGITRITEQLEQQVADEKFSAAQLSYRQLQNQLARVAPGANIGNTAVRALRESPELATDIQNHNRELKAVLARKNIGAIKREIAALREDAKAMLEERGELSSARQDTVRASLDQIIDLTERLDKNADQSDFGRMKELYEMLQAPVRKLTAAVSARSPALP